jgi:[CysO sulfur-carrier protein]-S-L-cysteine hydrolase
VIVPAELRRELERHAAEEVPNEACGLVLLREDRAVGYERGRNAEASPYRFRLEVEPEVWFLEDEGYELAVFHSHPSSPHRPSRADLERAGLWASRPWLILRTYTRELAAWRIENGRAQEVPIA